MKKSITNITLSERLQLIIDANPDRNCYSIYFLRNNIMCIGENATDQLKRPELVREEDYDSFLKKIYGEIREILDDYLRNDLVDICLWTGEYVFVRNYDYENGYLFSKNFFYALEKWIDPKIEELECLKKQILRLVKK